MAPVFRIEPAVQRYAWGHPRQLPDLLGFAADGGPYAEAWWGAHPAAPALAGTTRLDDFIAADLDGTLGPDAADEWGRLPYLLKVLAIAKPVSIQVHPTREQARAIHASFPAGTAPLVDDDHKPEMVVALTPMRLQVGFRPLAAIAADLRALGVPEGEALAHTVESGAVDEFLETVLTEIDPTALLAALVALRNSGTGSAAVNAAADAADAHPGDAGALVSLALNVIELQPGQACYVGAGEVHCYHSGLGLEIMASSDNVLRAGLTPKDVHVPLLLEIALTQPSDPVMPAQSGDDAARTFLSPASEFSLTVVTEGEFVTHGGPRIVLAVDGDAELAAGGQSLRLAAGQAAFVPHADGALAVRAHGLTAVASIPPAA